MKLSLHIMALGLALALPTLGFADLFTGFYTSSAPVAKAKPQTKIANETTGAECVSAILAAQERYDIPDNWLLAIGIQEAGRNGPAGLAVWPWAVNAEGEGVFFKTRLEAEAWVQVKRAEGVTSIDIGCMQVNMHWHGENFRDDHHAFDPFSNADYAARFLRNLYRETGDWTTAAGRYHSATKRHQKRYLASLERNKQVAQTQLSRLTALANSVVRPVVVAQAQVPKAPPPPVFWASDKDSGANYSIYSSQPLQPILPGYRDQF